MNLLELDLKESISLYYPSPPTLIKINKLIIIPIMAVAISKLVITCALSSASKRTVDARWFCSQLVFVGLFDGTQAQLKTTVCPRHRDLYGIRWRTCKKMCSGPVGWCRHKYRQYKGDRGITSIQSEGLYRLTKCLVPVDSRKYCMLYGLLKSFLN